MSDQPHNPDLDPSGPAYEATLSGFFREMQTARLFAAPIRGAQRDTRSPRGYTRNEIAAARRRGYIHGRHGDLGGALFWAGGSHVPDEIRQALADYQLLAAAVDREWHDWAHTTQPDGADQ